MAMENNNAIGCTWKITAAAFWPFSKKDSIGEVYNIGGLDIEENIIDGSATACTDRASRNRCSPT